MTIIFILLLLAVGLLAYGNGANDHFNGVASLHGSRTCGYRAALAWAVATTAAGSVAAIFLATALLENFSGRGLVPESLALSPPFLLSTACGAGATVLLATRLGFPISTTHALTGALVGAGLAAGPEFVSFGLLGTIFFLPLLLSPLLAMVSGAGLYLLLKGVRVASGIRADTCVCVGDRWVPLATAEGMAVACRLPALEMGTAAECSRRYQGSFLGIEAGRAVDALHFLSAGAVSFARGLNDTPKIAALLLVVPALPLSWNLAAVGAAMALGGLLGARRVAGTMSHKLTGMDPGQGCAANLSTALLVTTASLHGLPVSTTHVSVGSLLGMGAVTGQARWRTVRPVLASWAVTLPVAVVLAALAALLLR